MKRSPYSRLTASILPLLIAVLLLLPGASLLRAQESSSGAPAASSGAAAAKHEAEQEEKNTFRHSGVVQAIGHALHLDPETTAKIFEDLNSAVIILAVLFFVLRALPKAFRSRSENIQKHLVEARSATQEANGRLSVVEQRLAQLGTEIEAIREQAERDTIADEQRIRQSIEEEQQRIVDAARQEVDSAGAAARRELKRFAAELAIDRATQSLRLTPESDRALVEEFGRELASGKGGRN